MLFGLPASHSRAQAHSRLRSQNDQDGALRAHGAGGGQTTSRSRTACAVAEPRERTGSGGQRASGEQHRHPTYRQEAAAGPPGGSGHPVLRFPTNPPRGPSPQFTPALHHIISVFSPPVQVRVACPRRTPEVQGSLTPSTGWLPTKRLTERSWTMILSARCQCSQRWPGVEGAPGWRGPGAEVLCSISGPNDSTTMAGRAKDGNVSFRGDDGRLRSARCLCHEHPCRPVLPLTRDEVARADCPSAAFAVPRSSLSPCPLLQAPTSSVCSGTVARSASSVRRLEPHRHTPDCAHTRVCD